MMCVILLFLFLLLDNCAGKLFVIFCLFSSTIMLINTFCHAYLSNFILYNLELSWSFNIM